MPTVPPESEVKAILSLLPECFSTSLAHGWWDEQKWTGEDSVDPGFVGDVVYEKLALVTSETSEALEDVRERKMVTTRDEKGKPVGYPSELADVVVRIFDLVGALGLGISDYCCLFSMNRKRWATWRAATGKPATQIALVEREISDALTAWEDEEPHNFQQQLSIVVWLIEQLCSEAGTSLSSEMVLKMGYNQTRSYRHGGKTC